MAYVSVLFLDQSGLAVLGKPLLYPSELRTYGRATVVDCLSLRKAALALNEAAWIGVATVLSLKQRSEAQRRGPEPLDSRANAHSTREQALL